MVATPDDSFNLKHRLVGATVLILAAVVLLPRVLTEPDRDFIGSTGVVEREVFPQIKPEIAADIQPAISDSLDVSAGTTIEILDDVEATVDKESPGRFDPISKEMQLEVRSDATHSALASQPSSDTVVRGFIVQVGVFKEEENVAKLLGQLKNDGIHAKTELILISGALASRIWLGPFGTRSEALREGNKAMMRTNSKPIILEWP